MRINESTTSAAGSPPLTVTDRAQAHLAYIHRRAELPPGTAIAIRPGEDRHPRFASKRPDATDQVVAVREDGSALLIVPAPAAEALAGAILDFVVAPEPGFVILS